MYPIKLLADDEEVVLHKRPHWVSMVKPIIWSVIVIAAVPLAWIYVLSDLNGSSGTTLLITIAVAVLCLLIILVGPLIKWRTSHFVVSNRHLFYRTGLLDRTGEQIPLRRIQDVETEQSIVGRIFGFGTLVTDAASPNELKYRNVPRPLETQRVINNLLADTFRAPEAHAHYDRGDAEPLISS